MDPDPKREKQIHRGKCCKVCCSSAPYFLTFPNIYLLDILPDVTGDLTFSGNHLLIEMFGRSLKNCVILIKVFWTALFCSPLNLNECQLLFPLSFLTSPTLRLRK